jgi:DNA-binding NarL/FixJ family response regulator
MRFLNALRFLNYNNDNAPTTSSDCNSRPNQKANGGESNGKRYKFENDSRQREKHEFIHRRFTRLQIGTKAVASLTGRERQIMELVLDGKPSKIIAADLGICQRTVENHRAAIMHKSGAKSLPALCRMVFSFA